MRERKPWRKLLFSVGLCIGLLLFLRQVWVSYRQIQLHEFSLTRPLYLLAALGACLLMYVVLMLAWMMIMRYLGVPLSPRQTLQGYYLSFLPRYIPGTVWGYWSRSVWLAQSYSVDYAVSGMGSFLEALALVLTGLFMTGIYLTVRATGFERFFLALACASLLGLAWLVGPRFSTQIGHRFFREKLPLQSNLGRRFGAWSAAMMLHFAFWIAFGMSVHFAANAILTVSSDDLFASVYSASLSWIVGFVIFFVPTGIGVRELALSALLHWSAQVPSWQADVIAVISRFEIIVAELVWLSVGLGLYAREWWKNRHKRKRGPDSSPE